ncbi:hypothetical protein [Longimicrobium sp.]|uniref:hypothetical protein n=1 Tax=Longimicrobium sp. TaxID=2029185 RepID=UPI002B6F90C3|nr:hypothetical protein [Longimicrobium sp.]HSU16991.1 hypothetical protein [Longimicrobium sp.]
MSNVHSIPRTPRARRSTARGLIAVALSLAAGASAGFRAGPQPSPSSGYAYYGEAPPGGAWTAKNFDDLTRSDVPAYRTSGPPLDPDVEMAIREGDRLRARGVVNVRDRPWEKRHDEPAVIGSLRPGEQVVIREVRAVWLGSEHRRMAFWVRYEHPSRAR